jgi:hypothetical protein
MNNELEQITPEYAIQPNAISQSAYECGVNARKLIAMGMSLLPMTTHKNSVEKASYPRRKTPPKPDQWDTGCPCDSGLW